MAIWVVWLIVAAVLGVAELLTTTLAFGLMAVAAVIAGVAGAAGADFALQITAFVVAAGAGLGIARPIALRHIKQPPSLRTGTAALVGKTALVLEDITPHSGRVKIGGEEWSSRPYDDATTIPAGATVDVLEIRGATAFVYPRELTMHTAAEAIAIVGAVLLVLIVVTALRTIRIVPQARARNVERLGRYRKTLEPGLNLIIPFIDRVKPLIDLREQVVSFNGQPVITEDNLVVKIDTVLFFQVTDPRAADYEIVNYIQAIEQITATMLRSVIGSMDLEQCLTSRDKINTALRGVLDDASGKWGIRVTRVEIKAIDPPTSVKEAMEKQMRAEREKRAAILTAEGVRQSQILTAEGDRQATILRSEGEKQSVILKAEGQATAIHEVFQSIHDNDPDPKLLAYQYLQTLPQIAQGTGNSVWVIPSEVTGALSMLRSAFGGGDAAAAGAQLDQSPARPGADGPAPVRPIALPSEPNLAVEAGDSADSAAS